jgi:hypothetical protein
MSSCVSHRTLRRYGHPPARPTSGVPCHNDTWRISIYTVVCLTTDPQPLPKRLLHRVRSSASVFTFQYLFLSFISSSSCLRLLPRLLVTFIISSIFPSITRFRRQCLRNMWPIQLVFLIFIVCGMFFSYLSQCNTSSFLTRSAQMIISILPQHHISDIIRYFWSTFWSV